MKTWLLLVVGLLLASAFMVPSATATSSTPQIQVTGVASQYQTFSGTFWQNGSSTYQTGSTPWSFPVNFTNYTALTYSAFSIGVSVANILQPMVHVQQGTKVLLNNTGTGTFTVYPTSTANLVTTLPAANQSGGGTPNTGAYPVLEAAQLITEYQTLRTSTWALSGTTESQSFTLSSPKGVWLNQTDVFLPFPLPLSVNYSTVSVSVGTNSYSYVQVTSNGVYIADPSLAPSTSIEFKATFTVAPTESGASPVLIISNFTNSGTSPSYAAYTVWVNHLYPLWGGIYTIEFNFGYTPDPSSLNITVNGHVINSDQYLVSGNIITILPLVWTTPMNGTASFKFLFNLPSAPVQSHTSIATSVSFFGVTFTIGELLLFLIGVSMVGLVIIWVPRYVETIEGRMRKNQLTAERLYLTFGLVAIIFVSGAIYGLLR